MAKDKNFLKEVVMGAHDRGYHSGSVNTIKIILEICQGPMISVSRTTLEDLMKKINLFYEEK